MTGDEEGPEAHGLSVPMTPLLTPINEKILKQRKWPNAHWRCDAETADSLGFGELGFRSLRAVKMGS